jgi:hypothetical protein
MIHFNIIFPNYTSIFLVVPSFLVFWSRFYMHFPSLRCITHPSHINLPNDHITNEIILSRVQNLKLLIMQFSPASCYCDKIFSGYQQCQLVNNHKYFRDHLCHNHQGLRWSMLVIFNQLTWLISREDFIDFSHPDTSWSPVTFLGTNILLSTLFLIPLARTSFIL